MRITLFIVLLFITFVSSAFADSLWLSHSKENGSGFYTGLLLGGQFGRSSDKTGAIGYNADNDQWDYNESGANAALELGYSYHWRNLVVGPEIELGYLSMNGSGTQPDSPGSDTVGKTSSNFYTALRARAGIDFYSYLLYVTGGAIGVNYTEKVVDSCNIAPCGGGTVNAENSDFVWGYTVGAGAEHWFGKNWSLKLEYLYFNLSSQDFNGTTNLGNTYNWTGQTSGNIIRGGLNYYF